jgi:hypothetical protein
MLPPSGQSGLAAAADVPMPYLFSLEIG